MLHRNINKVAAQQNFQEAKGGGKVARRLSLTDRRRDAREREHSEHSLWNGQKLEEMTIGNFEMDASTASPVIYLRHQRSRGPISRAGFPNAMEDGVVERTCHKPQDRSRIPRNRSRSASLTSRGAALE